MITCGVSKRSRGFLQVPKASQTVGANGGIGAAIQGTGDTSTSNCGNFTAFDVTTGKRSGVAGAWHQKWDAPCYSGSMNTASGLTFIGHLGQQANAQDGKGYLEAVDTKTGRLAVEVGPDGRAGRRCAGHLHGGRQAVHLGGRRRREPQRRIAAVRSHGSAAVARRRIYTFVLP